AESSIPASFKKIGSKYYYIENKEYVNWFVAANRCRALDGHLVNFQSQEEFEAVMPFLNTDFDYWIGLNDLGSKRQYYSHADGRPAKYYNWHRGGPGIWHYNHCCVALSAKYRFHMKCYGCNEIVSFICEAS
ncbi:hypothetical protein KR222_007091, partial [Zaprionus bogoriensis]